MWFSDSSGSICRKYVTAVNSMLFFGDFTFDQFFGLPLSSCNTVASAFVVLVVISRDISDERASVYTVVVGSTVLCARTDNNDL